MSSSSSDFDFDFVRFEKLAAMRRYTQQKKLKSFVFFVEIALAFLVFWYSTYYVPALSDVAVDFFRRPLVVFGRSMYMFLLINVLVGVILFMSFQKPTKSDLYDDYVSASGSVSSSVTAASAAVTHSTDYKSESVTSTVTDRQLVCVENAEKKETATVVSAEETPADSVQTPSVVRKYSRTRSERYLKENRPKLRRSETVVRREKEPVKGGEEQPRRASSAMDGLSNEEFRSTIETFIASMKKSLIKENTLDFIKLDRSRVVLSR